MREPSIYFIDGSMVPYSMATVRDLQRAAAPIWDEWGVHPETAEYRDPDFRRRYAALILRERGL